MGVPTTVTFDEDVIERLNRESAARGVSIDAMLNEVVRAALSDPVERSPNARPFKLLNLGEPLHPELNYDCTAELLDYLDSLDNYGLEK